MNTQPALRRTHLLASQVREFDVGATVIANTRIADGLAVPDQREC